jgi:hypothetical protein
MSKIGTPVRRPSITTRVADNSGRTRVIESSYHMPYWAGQSFFDWEPNVSLPWMSIAPTTRGGIPFYPVTGPPAVAPELFVTDSTLVTVDFFGTGGYGVDVIAPGLWSWTAQIIVTNNGGSPATVGIREYMGVPLSGPEPIVRSEPDDFGYDITVPAGDSISSGAHSIFSWDGTVDGSRATRTVLLEVLKGGISSADATQDLSIVADLYICRFSPVGFWPATIE